jgi:outer membrane protein assembly factor BamB
MAALINGVAIGAPGDLLFTLTAPDPYPVGVFGYTVSEMDGDVLVAERNRRDPVTNAFGRAYLFDGTTGVLKTTFNNPEPEDGEQFARAIAGGDGLVFVLTVGVEERIYGFSAATGEYLSTMRNADGQGFGSTLTYGDGSVFASTPAYSVPFGPQSLGRAYLFDASTGELQRVVPNPEPNAGDSFGNGLSLSVFGSRVVVGEQSYDSNRGRVWVLDRSTGGIVLAIDNPNPDSPPPHFFGDAFGASFAANEQLIVVGAQEDETRGDEGSGTVYVFDTLTGALRHTLFSPQSEFNGEFGRSVAVTPDGDVLVGAWATSVDGISQAGHAYLFDGETGALLLDLPHPAPRVDDAFGWSVAASGNRLFVGAPNADPAGPAAGAVYVFEGIPEPGTMLMAATGALISAMFVRVVMRKKRRTV